MIRYLMVLFMFFNIPYVIGQPVVKYYPSTNQGTYFKNYSSRYYNGYNNPYNYNLYNNHSMYRRNYINPKTTIKQKLHNYFVGQMTGFTPPVENITVSRPQTQTSAKRIYDEFFDD